MRISILEIQKIPYGQSSWTWVTIPIGASFRELADRVKTLLGKLDSVRSSKERGSSVSSKSKVLFHKFMEQVQKIFENRNI